MLNALVRPGPDPEADAWAHTAAGAGAGALAPKRLPQQPVGATAANRHAGAPFLVVNPSQPR